MEGLIIDISQTDKIDVIETNSISFTITIIPILDDWHIEQCEWL